MNPMVVTDILDGNDTNLDPEYLICVAHETHNAIHYGASQPRLRTLTVRRPGDTRLW